MLEKYINNLNLPYGINLIDILVFIIFILILTHIIGSINRRRLSKKIRQIPGLEINQKVLSEIKDINQKIELINQTDKKQDLKISNLEIRTKDILDIKTLKYNPYRDMGVGGKQSFSTALIDKNGNGFILTNLYSRERTRVLLKEIQNFQPQQELAPEEKEVLDLLKNK